MSKSDNLRERIIVGQRWKEGTESRERETYESLQQLTSLGIPQTNGLIP